ncbi:MAG: M20 family metallopeptidase [Lentisphaerae bacterium]|nr:M20 family metallopeptidase [Lentisphaerota bacterium]
MNTTSISVTELLAELVACPSVNPADRWPIEPPFGEARLAALLATRLRSWGAAVTVRDVLPGRPNLVARFDGINARRSIMLESHSDTVQAADMTIPPFTPTVRDGRLYGRGACDTKGPMAAMLLGIRKVLDEDGRMPVTVYFASACDEELGARGARSLIGPDFRPDLAVVGEPTDLAICHAHKGTLRWRIRTQGVAAHSSAPERGVNAIYQMNRVLQCIEAEMIPALRDRRHPLLGAATMSVGTITGGTQANVVPAECTIEVDRRLLPGESREALTAEARAKLDALAAATPAFTYALDATQYYEPLEMPTDGWAAQVVSAGCARALGAARFVTAPWASNAGVFATQGLPSLLFGPGSIQQAHTKDEFIEVRAVEQAVGVYAEIIRECGRTTSWPASA